MLFRSDPEDEKLDITKVKIPRRKKPKKTISAAKSMTLDKYDAWRCTDRNIYQLGREKRCNLKFKLVPKILIKTFGWPTIDTTDYRVSGEYVFEDINLDLFVLYEFNQTNLDRPEGPYIRSVHKVNLI